MITLDNCIHKIIKYKKTDSEAYLLVSSVNIRRFWTGFFVLTQIKIDYQAVPLPFVDLTRRN